MTSEQIRDRLIELTNQWYADESAGNSALADATLDLMETLIEEVRP